MEIVHVCFCILSGFPLFLQGAVGICNVPKLTVEATWGSEQLHSEAAPQTVRSV